MSTALVTATTWPEVASQFIWSAWVLGLVIVGAYILRGIARAM